MKEYRTHYQPASAPPRVSEFERFAQRLAYASVVALALLVLGAVLDMPSDADALQTSSIAAMHAPAQGPQQEGQGIEP